MDDITVKALGDRLYDKRRQAALSVEKTIRQLLAQNTPEAKAQINKIIDQLTEDFAYAVHQPNARNGGSIGLAAVAIALTSLRISEYLDKIIQPVLACFSDQTAQVRYYACEALYNISKVAKGEILPYFNDIFDVLCRLYADSENSIKNGANLFNRLIKDIVSEKAATYISVIQKDRKNVQGHFTSEGYFVQNIPAQNSLAFSLPKFIPVLKERLFTNNPYTRLFLVDWIILLDSVPDLELITYLPSFLGGLLTFLTDNRKDVRVATTKCLNKFLEEIEKIVEVKKLVERNNAIRLEVQKRKIKEALDAEQEKKHRRAKNDDIDDDGNDSKNSYKLALSTPPTKRTSYQPDVISPPVLSKRNTFEENSRSNVLLKSEKLHILMNNCTDTLENSEKVLLTPLRKLSILTGAGSPSSSKRNVLLEERLTQQLQSLKMEHFDDVKSKTDDTKKDSKSESNNTNAGIPSRLISKTFKQSNVNDNAIVDNDNDSENIKNISPKEGDNTAKPTNSIPKAGRTLSDLRKSAASSIKEITIKDKEKRKAEYDSTAEAETSIENVNGDEDEDEGYEFESDINEEEDVEGDFGSSGGSSYDDDDDEYDEDDDSEDEFDNVFYHPLQDVYLDFEEINKVLIANLDNKNEEIQLVVLAWIQTLLPLVPTSFLQFIRDLLEILLGMLSSNDINKNIKDKVKSIDKDSLEFVDEYLEVYEDTEEETAIKEVVDDSNDNKHDKDGEGKNFGKDYNNEFENNYRNTGNDIITELAKLEVKNKKEQVFDNNSIYFSLVTLLTNNLLQVNEGTKLLLLDWLMMLLNKSPELFLSISLSKNFQILLKGLCGESNLAIDKDLALISKISENANDEMFFQLMQDLTSLFKNDRKLLESKGNFIIRKLCAHLISERVYEKLAQVLYSLDTNSVSKSSKNNIGFINIMVQILNSNLITAPELSSLRNKLRSFNPKDDWALFSTLFKSWAYNSPACLSLCLLTQNYELAYNLLKIFVELEITVNLLIQLEILVQLLESPVFVKLRLQLLEPERNPYLLKCLYGILMLLPQSDAFNTLQRRLNAINSFTVNNFSTSGSSSNASQMLLSPTTGGVGSPSTGKLLISGRKQKNNELLKSFCIVQAKQANEV